MKSKLHEEWYAAAEAKGKIEGKIEGAIENARNMLLLMLTEKFPALVEIVRGLLPDLNDQVRLNDLCLQAFKAKTEEEFRAFIGG